MSIKMLTILNALWIKIKSKLEEKKGQNTVEYLLMLSVIVGVVLVVGLGLKKWFPDIVGKIQGLIGNAAGEMAEGG